MAVCSIDSISTFNARYPLPLGAGSDAVHTDPEYSLAVTRLGSVEGGLGGEVADDALEALVDGGVAEVAGGVDADFGARGDRAGPLDIKGGFAVGVIRGSAGDADCGDV